MDGDISSDGVYDRFSGDFTFAFGLGAELGSGTRGAVSARALYYQTLGLSVGYADAIRSESELRRVLFVGTEVRPLFLPRWALDMQIGAPILDLALDSLAVSAGAYFGQWGDRAFANVAGFEATLGFGVPLFGNAEGPWLETRGTYRAALPGSDLGVLFLLSLYQMWVSPLIR